MKTDGISKWWWTTSDEQELKGRAGGDAVMVAAVFGRSPRAVQDKAKRLGVRPPRMPHALYWPEGTKARALRLRSSGVPISKISESTGVPFGTIRHWVYGVKCDKARA